ncbi:heme ABC transporter permease CcmC [Aquabacterium sp. OR-4]|uniref:heme ABC transporter permease CcmC n=1 Tax=Aquabacterium sp. OR-4 TaxID=2978127 RepID=UPI0028C906BD|nr:heme ABC transporter permease CcmC [Aquabacterium sp. OR-4]MDT7838712.1 heme ABC transporter permease CcmC [Aquabacterium sp. OR-4]
MSLNRIVFWFASPPRADALARRLIRPLSWLALALAVPGLWLGFVVTPADAVQGEGYRLIYLHVPASWLAMFCYAMLALWSAVGLVWRTRLSFVMAQALRPSAALWAALSLASGALWGRPMWGSWWVWDARLTSSLLLLLLVLGQLALQRAHDDPERADRSTALLAVLGALNLPVIYFSVQWWNTLHQGATITSSGARMATPMLVALLLCSAAAWAWTAAVVLRRFRLRLAARQRASHWLDALRGQASGPGPAVSAMAASAAAPLGRASHHTVHGAPGHA